MAEHENGTGGGKRQPSKGSAPKTGSAPKIGAAPDKPAAQGAGPAPGEQGGAKRAPGKGPSKGPSKGPGKGPAKGAAPREGVGPSGSGSGPGGSGSGPGNGDDKPGGGKPGAKGEPMQGRAADPSSGAPAGPQAGPLQWKRMFRWGWRFVGYARKAFLLSLVISLFAALLNLYQPILVGGLVNKLQSLASGGDKVETRAEKPDAAAPAGAAVDTADSQATPKPDADQDPRQKKKTKGWATRFFSAMLPGSLMVMAWLFLVVVALKMITDFATQWTRARADAKVTRRAQLDLHDRLFVLGPKYHRENDVGKTSATVIQFVQGAQQVLCGLYRTLLIQVLSFVAALAALYGQLSAVSDLPPLVVGLLLGALLVVPVAGWWIAKRLRDAATGLQEAYVSVQSEFMNSGTAPLEVQAMDAGMQRSAAFGGRLVRHARAKVRAAIFQAVSQVFNAGATPLLQAAFILALLLGAPDEPGALGRTAGVIVAVYLLIPQALMPVQQMVSFFAGISISWPQVKAALDLMEEQPEIKERPGAQALPVGPEQGPAPVALDAVTFSYAPGGRNILDQVSHQFPPGKISAIVARSGMGKSTLLNLLLRLYDVNDGAVRISGMDIRDATLTSLRKNVARVSQNPLFVTATVRENFRLSRADASDKDIQAACEATGLWDKFLLPLARDQKLTNPLDARFSRESGSGKSGSGGERRLMALTRALILDPAVLLLDEPTTGVDAHGVRGLAEIIRQSFEGKTVFLVDHNPNFVTDVADHVVCLENGKFVETGSPRELLDQGGLFKKLLDSFEA